MENPNLACLGEKIQRLATEVHGARKNGGTGQNSEFELMDALDELRASMVGPLRWPGTLFAPPDMGAMQVAFQQNLFQLVPAPEQESVPSKGKNGVVNGNTAKRAQDGPVKYPSIAAAILAKQTRMTEDQVVRVMRVLSSNLMFKEVAEKEFAHTAVSAGLADDMVAGRVGGIFNDLLKACTSLNDAIVNGQKSAWEERFGMSLYEYLEEKSPGDRAAMGKSMAVTSIAEAREVSTAFPWENFHKVADIGGSFGQFVAGILKAHPHLQGVCQDMPEVINDAKRWVQDLPTDEKKVFERLELTPHDYFTPQSVMDCDAFVLRRCLHNNSDEDSTRIMKAAVPGLVNGGPNSRLLVVEKLMPRWDEYSCRNQTKMLHRENLVMMISCGGKERNLLEFEQIAKAADWRYELDEVYHCNNHVAVMSFKVAEWENGS